MRSLQDILLRTPRLILRPLDRADAPRLFALRSDPKVVRYLSQPPWETVRAACERIALDAHALLAGEHVRLGIERTQDGLVVGECSLHNLNEASRRAEVGYALMPDVWRQGLAVEALAALIRFAFEDLGFNRLEADIDPRNVASAKVLARLRFEQEGLLRERWIVSGEVSDSALYGLLRSQWNGP